MKLTRRHWDILASVLIAVLLSSSVTLCMTDALDMSVRVSRILLFAGATAVWCALLVWNRPARAVGLRLGGAGGFCMFRVAGAGAELQVLLRTVAGLEKDASLDGVDIPAAAETWLTAHGMTAEAIAALQAKLK